MRQEIRFALFCACVNWTTRRSLELYYMKFVFGALDPQTTEVANFMHAKKGADLYSGYNSGLVN